MDDTLLSDLESTLGRFLLRGNRARLVDAALAHAPDGLDAGTYPALSGIARLGPLSTTQLAAEVGVDRSVASRQADRLVDAGLLARRPDETDARIALLTLTARGRRVVARSRQDLTRHLAEQLAGVSDRNIRATVDSLAKLLPEASE